MLDFLFVDYWPWWLSAAAFALMTVGIWKTERRLLGVSGSYSGLLRRPSPEDEKLRALEEEDPTAIEDAMLKATLEEFGPEAVEAFKQAMAEDDGPAPDVVSQRVTMTRGAHLAFLLMLVVGGVVGGALRGSLAPRWDLGALHTALLGAGPSSLLILVLGGVLVGLGTRMAGGCTSGHGLSGCSRAQPGSLVATGSFFGTAVAVSFLLEMLAG